MLEKRLYKDWKIYFIQNKIDFYSIGQRIIEQDYQVLKTLKNSERNYVALIDIKHKKYILKEFRSEIIIPQRKIQTCIKRGEALTTLINGIEVINQGLKELVIPIMVIIKKHFFIEKSFLLMEYIEGEKLKTINDVKKVIEITKKIHANGRYHGDLNTSNFLNTKNGIKAFDTQMKKESFFYFNRARDLLILKEDLLVLELGVNVENLYPEMSKKFTYRLGNVFRKIKKSRIIEKIREQKKVLRKKGWKI